MISTCTHTAVLATHDSVVAGDVSDVSVTENVITGYRLVDGDEVTEWGPGDIVAMDPVETGVPIGADDELAIAAADEILRANGWHRDGAWEYSGDGMTLYAPVEAF